MRIVKDIKYITKPFESAVITIGNFDGVHIGHQALLLKALNKAREIGGTSVAITFEPHPAQIINRTLPPKLITSYQHKNELISELGIDALLSIPFTKKFASISAADFIQKLLFEQIGMKIIVIGKDYSFGKNRTGNTEVLNDYAQKLKFKVVIEKWVQSSEIANNRISSTAIRNIIMEGDVESASKMLGRNYRMQGRVVYGKNRGKKILGFPTVNIKPDNDLYPKPGVYAVTIKHKNKIFNGVANIGYNPTFQNQLLSLEVHILSFNNDIYGEKIHINFIKRLRGEIKFPSISELSSQIRKDIDKASKILPPKQKNHF